MPTLDEMATFIYNEGSVYSIEVLSKQLKELEITQKASNTEAYQACEAQNVLKVHWFLTQAPPLGVFGVPRRKLIDVDEYDVALERTNQKVA
jgi:hypothetical protein